MFELLLHEDGNSNEARTLGKFCSGPRGSGRAAATQQGEAGQAQKGQGAGFRYGREVYADPVQEGRVVPAQRDGVTVA